jgi:hypothetical protein
MRDTSPDTLQPARKTRILVVEDHAPTRLAMSRLRLAKLSLYLCNRPLGLRKYALALVK